MRRRDVLMLFVGATITLPWSAGAEAQETGTVRRIAAKSHLPAIYATKEHDEVGGLMTYGPDLNAQFRRMAVYVEVRAHAACPTRISISFRTTAKSIGLVRKASAPLASALRLVSASP